MAKSSLPSALLPSQGKPAGAFSELLYLPIKDTNTHVILSAAPPHELSAPSVGGAAADQEAGGRDSEGDVPKGASVFVDESECRLIGEMLKREVCVLHHWLDCALHYHANHNVSSFLSILQDADYCANTVLYSNSDISNQPLAELPPVPPLAAASARLAAPRRAGREGDDGASPPPHCEGAAGAAGDDEIAADALRPGETSAGGWDGDWRVLIDAAMAAHHTHAALRARDQVTRHEELLRSEEWRQKAEAAAGLPEASRKKGGGVDVPLLMRKDPNLLSINCAAFLKIAKALILNVAAATPPAVTSGQLAGVPPSVGSAGAAPGGVAGRLGAANAGDGAQLSQSFAGLQPQQEQLLLQRQSLNELKGAEELFRLAAVHTPLHAAPLLGLASCAVYERRWEDALVYYCRLIAYSPPAPPAGTPPSCDSPEVRALISTAAGSRLSASSEASSQSAAGAASGKARLFGFCPRRYAADLRFAAGMCFLRLSRHAEARRAFQRAVAVDPSHHGALCGIALLLPASSSHHGDQQQLLLAAHRRAPSEASILLQLAARCLLAGDLRQAEGLLRVAQPAPFSLELLGEQRYLTGWLLQQQGQTWRAVGELRRAQQLRPHHPATVFRLAQCLLLLGGLERIKEAQLLLESLLRMLPRNFELRRLMGCALLAEAELRGLWGAAGTPGDGDDAKATADSKAQPEAAKRGIPGGAGITECLRLYQRALQELSKAAEANEDDPVTWMLLARCYESLVVTGQDLRFQRPCLQAYEKIVLLAVRQLQQHGGGEAARVSQDVEMATGAIKGEESDATSSAGGIEAVLAGRVALPEGVPLELLNNMAVLYLAENRPKRARALLSRVLEQLSASDGESQDTYQPRAEAASADRGGGAQATAGGSSGSEPGAADGARSTAALASASRSRGAAGGEGKTSVFAAASMCALRQLVAFNLALVLTSLGAYSSASAYLKELCGSPASSAAAHCGSAKATASVSVPSAWLLRARLAAERGDVLAAKRLCEAARATGVAAALSAFHPGGARGGSGSPDAALVLAEVFAGCGKIEAALAAAQRVAGLKNRAGERDPFALTFVAVLQRLKAKRLLQQQSIEKANAALAESRYFFTLSLQSSLSNCHAANGLAVLLAEENLTKTALSMLRLLLECAGCNNELKATVHTNCGLLLAALALTERPDISLAQDVSKADHQKLHRAFRHLMIALEASPMQKDLYLLMGRLLYDCVKFDAAVLVLQAAMQRWPNDLRVAYNLVVCMDARVCSDLRLRDKMQDPQVMRDLLCMCQANVQLLTRLMHAKRSWGHLDPHTLKQVRHGLLPPSALGSLESNAARSDGRVAIAPEGAEELPSLQQLETLLLKSKDKILPHLTKSLPLIEQNWKEQRERREAQRRDQEELRRSAQEKKQQKLLQEEAEQERQLELAERLMREAKEIAATLPLKREEEEVGGKKRGKAATSEKKRSRTQDDDDREFLNDEGDEDDDYSDPEVDGGRREGERRRKQRESGDDGEEETRRDRKKKRHREKKEKKRKKQTKEKKKQRHRGEDEDSRSEAPDEDERELSENERGFSEERQAGQQDAPSPDFEEEGEAPRQAAAEVRRQEGGSVEHPDAVETPGVSAERSPDHDFVHGLEEAAQRGEAEQLGQGGEDDYAELRDEDGESRDEARKKAKKHKKEKKKRKREKEKKKKHRRHAESEDERPMAEEEELEENGQFGTEAQGELDQEEEERTKRRRVDEEGDQEESLEHPKQ
ncbi:tetratricopeptide repeat-containing protein [Besnoitia besnoiti]|uniref:Tetratricopeptide repeat-containing protein n=1 Tax=Besnoitia besnoiti TaxID=94643 RepID=A0A2A9MCQ4_BESBE|nr:tetratricopeptide repeat-containing protein [Besnoitia besnoiti]PFH33180.1 tetratricopeptide repeat-containing protein [Besnoitia besnoiti]